MIISNVGLYVDSIVSDHYLIKGEGIVYSTDTSGEEFTDNFEFEHNCNSGNTTIDISSEFSADEIESIKTILLDNLRTNFFINK